MIPRSRALRLLLRLRVRGALRAQLRRLRRPSGLLFALLGLLLFLVWGMSLVLGRVIAPRPDFATGLGPQALRLGLFALFFTTVLGSLSHRGLYLPQEEIERLFSAPIARAELVRYRLIASLTRAVLSGLVFGLLSLGRLPHPVFGLLGVLITMLTLPILSQLASLVFGDAEGRLAKRLHGGWLGAGRATGVVLLLLMVLAFALGDHLRVERHDALGLLQLVLRSPLTAAILTPFEPWARMITAEDPRTFALWAAPCLLVAFVLQELAVRARIDFRELSLATSADVAKRLRRVRSRGASAATGEVSKRARGRRVPWVLGRGPFGAVAWLKLGSILRKARGTLYMSALVIGGLTLAFTLLFHEREEEAALAGNLAIAVLGTLYLTAGLRFDFRGDLEQMDVIKSWPLAPTRAFLATILPEVLLVAGALSAALCMRAAVLGLWPVELPAIALALPPFVLTWVALDNLVFLVAPVRFVPGQEGALHNVGRSLVVLFLRGLLLTVAAGMCALAAFLAHLCCVELLELEALAPQAAYGAGLAVLCAVAALLLLAGGAALRRFDPSRSVGV